MGHTVKYRICFLLRLSDLRITLSLLLNVDNYKTALEILELYFEIFVEFPRNNL